MINFTIADIATAFRETGIIPAYGVTLKLSGDKYCGCPLVAMAVNRSGLTPGQWRNRRKGCETLDIAVSELGINETEADGIVAGFDGFSQWRERSIEGYQLGVEARALVAPAGNDLK